MEITQHAAIRIAQRNLKGHLLNIIHSYASPVRDGYFFTIKDAREAASDYPSLREEIFRCVNVTLIIIAGKMVTVMRANRRKRHHLLKATYN